MDIIRCGALLVVLGLHSFFTFSNCQGSGNIQISSLFLSSVICYCYCFFFGCLGAIFAEVFFDYLGNLKADIHRTC